jgi:hypothetical protein
VIDTWTIAWVGLAIALVMLVVYLDRTKRWRALAAVMMLPSAGYFTVAAVSYLRSDVGFAVAWALLGVLWLLSPYRIIRRHRAAHSN